MWTELDAKYMMPTFRRQPVVLIAGQGSRVWGEDGKRYLDCVAGWAANILGHSHPAVVRALEEQAHILMLCSNQFYTPIQAQLAELLVKHTCLDKVFFCNGGAEAIEGAIKLARKYGKLHLGGAYEIISALNSFHGRTLAAIAASGTRRYQEPFEPMPQGFAHVPYNDVEAIKKATSERTCAVLLEPVQGEGGVNVPSENYLREVRTWCDERGILLILDEVQTGMGRLGSLFGYELFGVEPDIMAVAKGLGAGFPIGAFLAKERASVFSPGDHGTTFGGSPLACAVGYAVLSHVVANRIPQKAREMGDRLLQGLTVMKERFPFITEVRGMGLLLAVEFSQDISDQVVKACIDEGLLLNPVRPNAIRFMPPLTISPEEVDEAIRLCENAIARVGRERSLI